MKKVLGLDIGISSVGWGIIDQDTGEIIDAGVRLFEEATRNANEERRSFRGSRRLKRRKNHRLERAIELFEKHYLPTSGVGKINPYNARYKAIYDTVTKEELVAALYHLIKRRGTVLDSTEEERLVDNELSTKEQVKKNKKLLENKYVCEVQLDRLQNKHEKVRGHENRFRTEDYVSEAKAILYNQRKYHEEITDNFIKQCIDLIQSRRQYYEGPGSEKSPTPYGPYYLDTEGKLTYMSMVDKMRGKCSYFPGELRIAKMTYTADLFNLLSNDLNKLQINGEYLTYDDKLHLVENFVKKGKNITLKQILKYKGVPEDSEVRGYRIDTKTEKPIFTEFKGYKKLRKIIGEHQLPAEILNNVDLVDQIIEILTAEKSLTRREEQLKELFSEYTIGTVDRIINVLKEVTDFSGYHSLSKKAMKAIMDELWYTNKNQMELFTERGFEEKRLSLLTNRSKITFDDQAILSTVAKRAHREAIKIVNELRKLHGEFDAIVVETAREKNSDEKKTKLKDYQKQLGKIETNISKELGVKSLADLKLSSKQHLALKLCISQDRQCIYSGKRISLHDIIGNFSLFEIDHIVPISISFDDSQLNKVLCYHSENQNKGQRTPFQYYSSGKATRSFEEFKADVLKLYNSKLINKKKRDYLLEMRDVQHNEELQREFINRNLIDTQYAMRSFSMNLRSFFKANNIETKVFSIRGSFTAALRRRARFSKNREESHAHHAIDALIVAAIGRMPIFDFFKKFKVTTEGVIFEKNTGEVIEEQTFFNDRYMTFIRSLLNYESKVKISHKVNRKVNRTLSNQTIYTTREKDGEVYYLGKTSNIYELDKQSCKAVLKRIDKNPHHFLIAQHNPELFDLILKIVEEYKEADNPFRAYYEEHGYILKDGKVPVKTLRYYDRKLGVHMNITEKYPNAKNDVVLLSIKSLRVDIYKNKEGKYKYLGVPYHWFKQKGDHYILDMEKYNAEKAKPYKKIDESFEFQFSLYRNDRFSFEKNGEYQERIFLGDNNPRQNILEVDYIDKKKADRKEGLLTISTLENITKYNVDVLGNKYKISKEKLRNYLQI